MAAIILAMKVATAAPVTPQAGNGPMPIIRNGSNTTFIPTLMAEIIIGVQVSPQPRKIEAKVIIMNMNGTELKTILMYGELITITSSGAPMKARSGSVIRTPMAERNPERSARSMKTWPADFLTSAISFMPAY